MNQPPRFSAFLHQTLLTLRLNFRSPQPLIFGFLVPLLFLLAFGAVFRGSTQPLRDEMAQLLTISILGGACFGLPTALVSERERGVWRQFRLLPLNPAWLLAGTLAARVLLIAAAAALQLTAAHLLYGTPWPACPLPFAAAFLLSTLSFLGLGLLLASLAHTVLSVQAIGQCLFLPMLMIGGVGIPLTLLPEWACQASGFMPGRYAVTLLHNTYTDSLGLHSALFQTLALAAIGLSAFFAGVRLFRWDKQDAGQKHGKVALLCLLLPWMIVGTVASASGRLGKNALLEQGLERMTPALLASISYDDLPGDSALVTRLAPPFPGGIVPLELQTYRSALENWGPANSGARLTRIRNLLALASLADVNRDQHEAQWARLVFDKLIREYPGDELAQALGFIILSAEVAEIPLSAPELGLHTELTPDSVRERSRLYAKKLLGRLLGKLQEVRSATDTSDTNRTQSVTVP